MSRLVVISNRLADPRKPAAGGLAVALGEALNQTGGLWFGWSGTVVEGGTPGEGELHTRQAGPVTLATVDLCREDHHSYYHGYSNSVLWPVFHYRLDLADFNASFIAGYRRVNQMFARKLLPLLRDDDVIWTPADWAWVAIRTRFTRRSSRVFRYSSIFNPRPSFSERRAIIRSRRWRTASFRPLIFSSRARFRVMIPSGARNSSINEGLAFR